MVLGGEWGFLACFFNRKGQKEASFFDFSRQDAESQSFEGRYAFYGTRIERIKWIFKDFDSFAIMDGSGFISSILAVISTSRLPSPLESPDNYREGVRILNVLIEHGLNGFK